MTFKGDLTFLSLSIQDRFPSKMIEKRGERAELVTVSV